MDQVGVGHADLVAHRLQGDRRRPRRDQQPPRRGQGLAPRHLGHAASTLAGRADFSPIY